MPLPPLPPLNAALLPPPGYTVGDDQEFGWYRGKVRATTPACPHARHRLACLTPALSPACGI